VGRDHGDVDLPNTGAAAAKSSTTVYACMCFDPVVAHRFRSEHTEVRSTFNVEIGQPRCGIWPSEVKAGKQRIAQTDTFTPHDGALGISG
jgi:hypothetical protein